MKPFSRLREWFKTKVRRFGTTEEDAAKHDMHVGEHDKYIIKHGEKGAYVVKK